MIKFGASIWARFPCLVLAFVWFAMDSLGLYAWISFGFDLGVVWLGLQLFCVTPAFWCDLALVCFVWLAVVWRCSGVCGLILYGFGLACRGLA